MKQSPSPALIAWNAIRVVCSDDEQYRVMVVPGRLSKPSITATTRPMLKPDSPPGRPHPRCRSSMSFGSSCGSLAHRPVIVHRAGGGTYRGAAETKPIACGMFTGYGGSEPRVAVTRDGAVVYEPAVLTPGLAGTGYAPGAPGPRPQTQVSPGGLSISSNQGATWRFVKPAGVTWTPQDDQLFVDRRTGRIFWYALEPNPVPQSGGVDPQDQIPFGYANLLTSADDGRTWTYAAVPGYAASENPRFAAAPAPREQPKPADYPNVASWRRT